MAAGATPRNSGKFEAGIDQCGRLAGTWRADEEVPWQVVKVVLLSSARRPKGPERVLHLVLEDKPHRFLLFGLAYARGKRSGFLLAAVKFESAERGAAATISTIVI